MPRMPLANANANQMNNQQMQRRSGVTDNTEMGNWQDSQMETRGSYVREGGLPAFGQGLPSGGLNQGLPNFGEGFGNQNLPTMDQMAGNLRQRMGQGLPDMRQRPVFGGF
jgi:hypothetical protein